MLLSPKRPFMLGIVPSSNPVSPAHSERGLNQELLRMADSVTKRINDDMTGSDTSFSVNETKTESTKIGQFNKPMSPGYTHVIKKEPRSKASDTGSSSSVSDEGESVQAQSQGLFSDQTRIKMSVSAEPLRTGDRQELAVHDSSDRSKSSL